LKGKIQYNFVISHQNGRIKTSITLTLWRPSPISLSQVLSIYFLSEWIAPPEKWSRTLFISFPSASTRLASSSCSPWRAELSSPLGLCHVILGRQNRPCSPPKWFHSPWRVMHSPWRVGGELVASKHASLPIFFFVSSPWRAGLLGRRVNMWFCLFLPCCTWLLVFHLRPVSWVIFLHN